MKNYFPRTALVTWFVACIASAPTGFAQAEQIALAGPDWEARALGRMVNQPIRANTNEPLSHVVDYLVEPVSGQLRYAVVPSGRGPEGETFRLVPIAALDPSSNEQGLKIRIDRWRWDQVGTLTQGWLRDRVSMDASHRHRIAQQFGGHEALPDDGATVMLVRASSLKGKVIQSGRDQLATIRDIAIDLPHRVVWALVNPRTRGVGTEQNYLFPFSGMQIPADDRGVITSTIARNAFRSEQPLTPTGFPGAAAGGQQLRGTVNLVEQALQNVPSIPRGNVQVVPESRIVLRGTVENEQQKTEAHRAAIQAAPGVRVDNEITVRSRWQ